MTRQITRQQLDKYYIPASQVLKFVGAGFFLAATLTAPNLPKALKPFLKSEAQEEFEAWRILKYALDKLEIRKPVIWDNKWRLVSFDIPETHKSFRELFTSYLKAWGFYKYHNSVYLHAYPCEKEVDFIREYLRISKWVCIIIADKIENDHPFKHYFGL